MAEPVYAAGTVCWRQTKKGNIKVLLIRRVKYNDWSLPKGKVDPGETMPVTAVRETFEETGLKVSLGVNLGTINYEVPAGKGKKVRLKKTVQYWAAKIPDHVYKTYRFKKNDEVLRVKWVRIDKVSAKLTYPADQELFKVFEKLTETKKQETFSLILLRHAKALPAGGDIKSDAARPLSDHGMKQSLVIVPTLESFGAQKAFSSTALRCLDTLAPFAEHTGIEVTPSEAISQDSWEAGETSGLRQLITDLVAAEESAIVCSHAPVLPDLAREIAAQTVSSPGRYLASAAELPTAAFSIFHISHESKDIVAVETYPIKA